MAIHLAGKVLALDFLSVRVDLVDLEGREVVRLPAETPIEGFAVELSSCQAVCATSAVTGQVVFPVHFRVSPQSALRAVRYSGTHSQRAFLWRRVDGGCVLGTNSSGSLGHG